MYIPDAQQSSSKAIVVQGELAIQKQLKKTTRQGIGFNEKKWQRNREQFSHMDLPHELIEENNPDEFRNHLQMTDECFQQILSAVTPLIQKKKNSLLRRSISAEQSNYAFWPQRAAFRI